MAGAYPDAPDRRMAYHADGTIVHGVKNANAGAIDNGPGIAPSITLADHSVSDKNTINDESQVGVELSVGSGNKGGWYWFLVFPELREIDGYYWNWGTSGVEDEWLYYSTNTTNSRDGSWTALGSQVRSSSDIYEDYRDSIATASVSGVRGLNCASYSVGSVGGFSDMRRFHVYGAISSGETPDRILFLDAENSDVEFSKPLDYGDVPRSQSQDYNIKLKNNSGTLTANTVTIDADTQHESSDTWYTFSDDGGMNFSSSLNIGNLGPGATQAIVVRQNVPGGEAVGLHAAYIQANTASWS